MLRPSTEAVRFRALLEPPSSRISPESPPNRSRGQQWTAWLLDRYSSAYASNQYRALQQFFKWLAAEDELPDPTAGLQSPPVPQQLIPVFASQELARLDQACADRSFAQRRTRSSRCSRRLASGWPSWPALATTPATRGTATLTCGSGRSPSAARAASPGSSESATGHPAASTGTCGRGPGTERQVSIGPFVPVSAPPRGRTMCRPSWLCDAPAVRRAALHVQCRGGDGRATRGQECTPSPAGRCQRRDPGRA